MNKTILIADPSSIMRRIIERALRLAGLEAGQIYEAADGPEALALAQEHQPDLILSDTSLAGLDGLQLLSTLRENESTRDLPLVFISSQAGETHVHRALELGARGYIRKPFTAEHIREYIAPLFT